jgi:autotransporter-associated beta strand protein
MRTIDVNANTATLSGALSDSANSGGGLIKAGPGLLNISGNNTYSGGTVVQNGTLQLGGSAALSTGALAVNAGTLDLNGFSATVSSFSGAAGIVTDTSGTTGGNATPFYVNQSTSTTFAGSFQTGLNGRYVSLYQQGGGTLTLTSTSTVGSANVQNSAMLVIDGAVTASDVNVTYGGQIGGTGAIGLSFGDAQLTYSSSAASNFAGTISGTAGFLEVDSGTLTVSGANTYMGGTQVDGTGMLILTNSEALADGSSLTVGDASAFDMVVPAQAISPSSAITPVPEPGTLWLVVMVLGTACVMGRRRVYHADRRPDVQLWPSAYDE